MALFASLAAAETRARAKVADGTWSEAFACLSTADSPPKFAVRVQRKMSSASAGARQNGGWVDITDDGTV